MTTLILGGPGRSGSRVFDRLTVTAAPVRFASRRTGFDWDDRGTWATTVRGSTAAYVCFTPDLAFPGVPAKMEALGVLAAQAGLERLVLLSGRGEERAKRPCAVAACRPQCCAVPGSSRISPSISSLDPFVAVGCGCQHLMYQKHLSIWTTSPTPRCWPLPDRPHSMPRTSYRGRSC